MCSISALAAHTPFQEAPCTCLPNISSARRSARSTHVVPDGPSVETRQPLFGEARLRDSHAEASRDQQVRAMRRIDGVSINRRLMERNLYLTYTREQKVSIGEGLYRIFFRYKRFIFPYAASTCPCLLVPLRTTVWLPAPASAAVLRSMRTEPSCERARCVDVEMESLLMRIPREAE
jgi:hypothetical protein